MTIPRGPISPAEPASLANIQTEFGGSGTISLSEYYAGGGIMPNPAPTSVYQINGVVPTSGTISISNFLGLGVGATPPPPPPAGPGVPVANFSATPTSGLKPVTVQFTDQSSNSPTSWAWDFDNNGSTDSTAQNPSYVYSAAGVYSVKLTVTNADGSNTRTQTNYVIVKEPFIFNYTISSNLSSGFDVRAAALGAGWDGVVPLYATINIDASVVVSGTITADGANAAFYIPNLPSGSTVLVNNNGSIIGQGGQGGAGGSTDSVTFIDGSAGGAGGLALRAQYQTTFYNYGLIIGGGGGGGGGGAMRSIRYTQAPKDQDPWSAGGGGGGGGGQSFGIGGAAGIGTGSGNYGNIGAPGVASPGANGTATSAGAGGSRFTNPSLIGTGPGGPGGLAGQAGSSGEYGDQGYGPAYGGQQSGPGAGGPAGPAIVGLGYLVLINSGVVEGDKS